jgi:hypothetical protein
MMKIMMMVVMLKCSSLEKKKETNKIGSRQR